MKTCTSLIFSPFKDKNSHLGCIYCLQNSCCSRYLRFIGDPEVGEDDHEGQEELEAELRKPGAPVAAVCEAELGLAGVAVQTEDHAGPGDGAPGLGHNIGAGPDQWQALIILDLEWRRHVMTSPERRDSLDNSCGQRHGGVDVGTGNLLSILSSFIKSDDDSVISPGGRLLRVWRLRAQPPRRWRPGWWRAPCPGWRRPSGWPAASRGTWRYTQPSARARTTASWGCEIQR